MNKQPAVTQPTRTSTMQGMLPDDEIQIDPTTGKPLVSTDDIWEAIHHCMAGEEPVSVKKVKDQKLKTGFRAFFFYRDTPEHRASIKKYLDTEIAFFAQVRRAQQRIKQLTFDS